MTKEEEAYDGHLTTFIALVFSIQFLAHGVASMMDDKRFAAATWGVALLLLWGLTYFSLWRGAAPSAQAVP